MAAGDLTTLGKVKGHLGLTDVSADAVLERLITGASVWVTAQIGHAYGTSTVTETRDGDGTTRLLLNRRDATAVTSVTVDGSAVPTRPTVNDNGWVFYDGGVSLVGYEFTEGVQNVIIVYTAGVTCPQDLENAVIELVADGFRRRGNEGLSMASMAGEAASFVPPGNSWAPINTILDAYRPLVIG